MKSITNGPGACTLPNSVASAKGIILGVPIEDTTTDIKNALVDQTSQRYSDQ